MGTFVADNVGESGDARECNLADPLGSQTLLLSELQGPLHNSFFKLGLQKRLFLVELILNELLGLSLDFSLHVGHVELLGGLESLNVLDEFLLFLS